MITRILLALGFVLLWFGVGHAVMDIWKPRR